MENRVYTLGFPNKEIEDGFLESVMQKFVTVPDDDLGLAIDNLRGNLKKGNTDLAPD